MTFRTKIQIAIGSIIDKTYRLQERVLHLERRLDKLDKQAAQNGSDSAADSAQNTDKNIT